MSDDIVWEQDIDFTGFRRGDRLEITVVLDDVPKGMLMDMTKFQVVGRIYPDPRALEDETT